MFYKFRQCKAVVIKHVRKLFLNDLISLNSFNHIKLKKNIEISLKKFYKELESESIEKKEKIKVEKNLTFVKSGILDFEIFSCARNPSMVPTSNNTFQRALVD